MVCESSKELVHANDRLLDSSPPSIPVSSLLVCLFFAIFAFNNLFNDFLDNILVVSVHVVADDAASENCIVILLVESDRAADDLIVASKVLLELSHSKVFDLAH